MYQSEGTTRQPLKERRFLMIPYKFIVSLLFEAVNMKPHNYEEIRRG